MQHQKKNWSDPFNFDEKKSLYDRLVDKILEEGFKDFNALFQLKILIQNYPLLNQDDANTREAVHYFNSFFGVDIVRVLYKDAKVHKPLTLLNLKQLEELITMVQGQFARELPRKKMQLSKSSIEGKSEKDFVQEKRFDNTPTPEEKHEIKSKQVLASPFFKERLINQEDLKLQDHVHVLTTGTKVPKEKKGGSASERDKKKWIMKEDIPKTLMYELIAQEWDRMIRDPEGHFQPKTRLTKSLFGQKISLISEKKEGFTPLGQIAIEDFRKDLKQGTLKNFASSTIMAVLVSDTDRHTFNEGKNAEQITSLDKAHSFKVGRLDLEPSASLLRKLPFLEDDSSFQPSNWFGLYRKNTRDTKTSYVTEEMSEYKGIVHEKNLTLLKVLSMPVILVKNFVKSYTNDTAQIEELSNWLINRNQKFVHAALQMEAFREYLASSQSESDLDQYLHTLAKFKTMRKNYLLGDPTDIDTVTAIKENVKKALTSPGALTTQIIEKKDSGERQKLIEENSQQLNETGWIPLYIAAEQGDVDLLRACLNAKPNLNTSLVSSWTPLHLAAKNGHIDVIKELLNQENIPIENTLVSSALYVAAAHGQLAVVNTLLEDKRFSQNINAENLYLQTALYVAAKNGHVKVMQALISAGADINKKNQNLKTPLHIAIEQGHLEAIKLLLANNAKNTQNKEGSTALHVAVNIGSAELIKTLLENKVSQEEVDAKNKNNNTPLHLAASQGRNDIVKLLLDYKADVNTHNDDFNTPLFMAIGNNHSEVVRTLVNAQAKNSVNAKGWNVLHYAAEKSLGILNVLLETKEFQKDINLENKFNTDRPLHLAVKKGDASLIQGLLSAKADFTAKNHADFTPLYLAVSKGQTAAVKTLIEAKAQSTVNNQGWTELHVAAKNGHLDIINLLLSNEFKVDINAKGREGKTPLYLAEDVAVAGALLKARADVNVTTPDNITPLHVAVKNDRLPIVKSLLKAKANAKALTKGDQISPLHYARSGHVIQELLAQGADVTTKNKDKWTPLHSAVINNKPDVVKALLSAMEQKSVNAKNSDGSTALLVAAEIGNLDIIDALLKAKANANAKNEGNIVALNIAVELGKLDVVKLLLKAGVKINIKDRNKNTLLHNAVILNHPLIVKELLENKKQQIDVNAKNVQGWTALRYAIERSDLSSIKALIDAKADINAKFRDSQTALMLTVKMHESPAILQILLEAKAKPQLAHKGKTPLDLAIEKSDLKAALLLLDYGAKIKESMKYAKDPQVKACLILELLKIYIQNHAWRTMPDIAKKQLARIKQAHMQQQPVLWTDILNEVDHMAEEEKAPNKDLIFSRKIDMETQKYLKWFSSPDTLGVLQLALPKVIADEHLKSIPVSSISKVSKT